MERRSSTEAVDKCVDGVADRVPKPRESLEIDGFAQNAGRKLRR
jgi:hypothetical protein